MKINRGRCWHESITINYMEAWGVLSCLNLTLKRDQFPVKIQLLQCIFTKESRNFFALMNPHKECEDKIKVVVTALS